MMNYELINKLGSQAQQSVRRQQLVDLDFLAKFAELIVKECADTIKSNQWAKDNQAFSKGMNYSAELIKEHFGAEE